MTPGPAPRLRPLVELYRFRMWSVLRDRQALFWLFCFPLLLSLVLAWFTARSELPPLRVAVVTTPGGGAALERLRGARDLELSEVPRQAALQELRLGRVDLVVEDSDRRVLHLDPTRERGRSARNAVLAALAAGPSAPDRPIEVSPARGSRYIDFLVPGLLAVNIINLAFLGLGLWLVPLRKNRVLRQLAASPMRRSHFFAALVLVHITVVVAQIPFFILFARLLFDFQVAGNLVSLFAVGLLGAASAGGLAILLASRGTDLLAAGGILNTLSILLMFLSGVFFSLEELPGWFGAVMTAQPLCALVEALRGICLEGARLIDIWPLCAVMAGWGVVCLALGARLFRWE
jgi:ABC-2 type transport system permease protein